MDTAHHAPSSTAPSKSSTRYSAWLLDHLSAITIAYVVLMTIALLFFLRSGDDLAFHLQRMDAIMSTISEQGIGSLPIRLYDTTLWGYGYASPLFYCDLFFYPFALVGCFFQFSVVTCYKLMTAAVWVASYFVARSAFGWIFPNKQRNVAVAVYMLSITIFANITSAAVGRSFAAIFAPLAVCGLWIILHGKREGAFSNQRTQWVPLCLGMTGLVFSNVLDTAIVFAALLLLFVFSFKSINRRVVANILVAAVVALALCAWFLCPFLEQMSSDQYFASDAMGTFDGWTLPLIGLILPRSLAILVYNALGISTASLSPGWMAGIVPLGCIAFFAFRYRQRIPHLPFAVGAIVILVVGIWVQTPFTPLVFENKISGIFQVPWRLGIIMYCMAALLLGFIGAQKKAEKAVSLCITLSMVVLSLTLLGSYGHDAYLALRYQSVNADHSYNSASIGACDYVPTTFVKKGDADIFAWEQLLTDRGEAVICSDESTQFTAESDGHTITVSYDADNPVTFEFPRIYYKGYTAQDSFGHELEVSKAEDGLVQVKANEASGTITLAYGGTFLQHLSVWPSLIALIALIAFLIAQRVRRTKGASCPSRTESA